MQLSAAQQESPATLDDLGHSHSRLVQEDLLSRAAQIRDELLFGKVPDAPTPEVLLNDVDHGRENDALEWFSFLRDVGSVPFLKPGFHDTETQAFYHPVHGGLHTLRQRSFLYRALSAVPAPFFEREEWVNVTS